MSRRAVCSLLDMLMMLNIKTAHHVYMRAIYPSGSMGEYINPFIDRITEEET